MQQEQIKEIIGNLADLQASLSGNQAACEKIVSAQNQLREILARDEEQREAFLVDYRNDALCQLDRQGELMDLATGELPDSELFGIWAAAQLFVSATKNYFDLRNMTASERLTTPKYLLEN
ncbi:MAG: hypothetical protein OEV64_02280 [Desulfobulbaceae bacterium]|nr:hypothetical protein [Desulfobulbaceae bacterium]